MKICSGNSKKKKLKGIRTGFKAGHVYRTALSPDYMNRPEYKDLLFLCTNEGQGKFLFISITNGSRHVSTTDGHLAATWLMEDVTDKVCLDTSGLSE